MQRIFFLTRPTTSRMSLSRPPVNQPERPLPPRLDVDLRPSPRLSLHNLLHLKQEQPGALNEVVEVLVDESAAEGEFDEEWPYQGCENRAQTLRPEYEVELGYGGQVQHHYM